MAFWVPVICIAPVAIIGAATVAGAMPRQSRWRRFAVVWVTMLAALSSAGLMILFGFSDEEPGPRFLRINSLRRVRHMGSTVCSVYCDSFIPTGAGTMASDCLVTGGYGRTDHPWCSCFGFTWAWTKFWPSPQQLRCAAWQRSWLPSMNVERLHRKSHYAQAVIGTLRLRTRTAPTVEHCSRKSEDSDLARGRPRVAFRPFTPILTFPHQGGRDRSESNLSPHHRRMRSATSRS